MSEPIVPLSDGVMEIKPLETNPNVGSSGATEGSPFPLPMADPGAASMFKSLFASALPQSGMLKKLSEMLQTDLNLLDPSQTSMFQKNAMVLTSNMSILSKFAGAVLQSVKKLTIEFN